MPSWIKNISKVMENWNPGDPFDMQQHFNKKPSEALFMHESYNTLACRIHA